MLREEVWLWAETVCVSFHHSCRRWNSAIFFPLRDGSFDGGTDLSLGQEHTERKTFILSVLVTSFRGIHCFKVNFTDSE